MRTKTLSRREKVPQAKKPIFTESNDRIDRLLADLETDFITFVKAECDVFSSVSKIKERSLLGPRREGRDSESPKSVLKDFRWSIKQLEKSQQRIMILLNELSSLLSNTGA